MPSYSYKIRQPDEKIDRGILQAATQNEAVEKVRRLGGVMLEVSLVDTKKPVKGGIGLGGRISLKDKIILTEQLAVMLNAGVTLVQALHGLQEESTNRKLAKVLEQLIVDVESGLTFSAALEKHPAVFSRIFFEMVRSSEKTGNLADILRRLTGQQQKEYELKGKVRGALMYPAIISVLLIGVIVLVITFILPRLTGLFTESAVSLPASTKILLAISDIFVHKWYLLLGGLFGIIFGFRFSQRTKQGKRAWDMFILKVPILGGFLRKSYIARFSQSFASLAQAGVPVLDVFKTLRGIMGNVIYEEEIDKISNDVANGIKVSVAIRKSKYFPGMVGQLVSVGEQSGDLAGIFSVLADFFEKEVDGMAKNLSTLLEPIIMIVMGVGVAFILISVLQPIFNLSNAI